MQKIDEVYKNLTNVDIYKQRELWDERGKGYYGEYMLFQELYTKIPGVCKILMNLNIPVSNGRTTEIDLLMIHETGLYVFEVKHYKGDIYGKYQDANWTQYFRTSKNQIFTNPIKQNQYHIDALKLKYHELPMFSYIVFTNCDCNLHVKCETPKITVCQLCNIYKYLSQIHTKEKILSLDQIDEIFNELSQFSPASNEQVIVDCEPQLLNSYFNKIRSDYQDNLEKLEDQYKNLRKKTKKTCAITVVVAFFVCVCFALGCFLIGGVVWELSENKVAQAYQELEEFKQKFEEVDLDNLSGISIKKNFVRATDVSVIPSQDLNNAVNLQFSLKWNGELYGARIDNNKTKIIVILKNGAVKEYSLSDDALPYSKTALRLGIGNSWYLAYKNYKFPTQELRGLNVENIAYIKLSNCGLWEMGGYNPKDTDLYFEVEIYKS